MWPPTERHPHIPCRVAERLALPRPLIDVVCRALRVERAGEGEYSFACAAFLVRLGCEVEGVAGPVRGSDLEVCPQCVLALVELDPEPFFREGIGEDDRAAFSAPRP